MSAKRMTATAVVLVCAGVLAGLTPGEARGQEARQVERAGEVTGVTLYRGQAQVTRTIEVGGEAGPIELIVGGLPARVEPRSLFAEGEAGVEVRAVRFRQRVVGEEPREKVRALDERIEALGDQLNAAQAREQVLAHRDEYLDKLDRFVVPAANVEMSKGVLDPEALVRITEFVFEQREAIAESRLTLQREQRGLRESMDQARRERAQLATGHRRTVYEAVVFFEKREAGADRVRLNYLVSNCGWSPVYNFRGEPGKGRATLEYNALIQQMSGEDWDGVKLTLSTATPRLSAASPTLSPFYVALRRGGAGGGGAGGQSKGDGRKAAEVYYDLSRGQYAAVTQMSNAIDGAQVADQNWNVNVLGNTRQLLELSDGDKLEEGRPRQAAQTGPSLSYALKDRVSLPSRSDQQMVRIVRDDVVAEFYFVATPVLSEHVYREALLSNSTGEDLLGGPVSVYLRGQFVGRAEIDTVAKGQRFVASFGADPQIKTMRRLIDRSEEIQGGNQVITARYELAVENLKDKPAAVRLFDRVPYAGMDNGEVKLTLLEMSPELSDDPAYKRLERSKGILRWDLTIDANAAGEGARKIDYGYTLEFDRNARLANPAQEGGEASELRGRFEELEMDRRRK